MRLKTELIIITTTSSISKVLSQTWQKLTKSITKTLIVITLDTSHLKKIADYKNIHSVNPLYLLCVNQASEYVEQKMEMNT